MNTTKRIAAKFISNLTINCTAELSKREMLEIEGIYLDHADEKGVQSDIPTEDLLTELWVSYDEAVVVAKAIAKDAYLKQARADAKIHSPATTVALQIHH